MGRGVAFSSYLGGGDIDSPTALTVDAAGRAHVAGFTDSLDFPWTPGAPGQSFTPEPFGSSAADGFYSRLSADGSSLLYSTYINGKSNEYVTAVAVDPAGAAYIAGYTESTDFLTARAMQPSSGGSTDGFLMKVGATGTLEFSTYLGREGRDYVWDVAANSGFVYVTGDTSSRNFPVSGGTGGTYLVKMPADGSTFARALMVPRPVNNARLAVDRYERAYLVGRVTDAWTAATTADAAQPRNAGSYDVAFAMFTMGSGQPDAPLYATFFGGSSHDDSNDVAVDSRGNVYVAGWTASPDFPFVNAPAGPFNGGGFVTRFSVAGIPRRDTPGEVVLYASDVQKIVGAWTLERDPSAGGGTRLFNRDAGAVKLTAPLAAPADYVEFTFPANAGVPYHLWIRGKAFNDHWSNDSIYVQFSDSIDAAGNAVWRTGTTSGTSVNLEDCSNCGLAGWGWQDNGYGAGVLGPHVRFATSGTHTVRIQVREDGFSFDQIVLSSGRFISSSPGALKRDSIVLPRSNPADSTPPPDDPPPSTCSREVVVHAGISATPAGAWVIENDAAAASGRRVRHPDAGAPKQTAPLAAPANYFDV
ncbi:MAG: SBBP repeat-containing protein, partial [Aldersonia sp.]|nr:SBBP repeat-containing protein [Aldersonia sp.]